MASIDLTTLTLADAVTGEVMAFPLMSRLTVTPRVDGEVRARAGGRRVAFGRPGITRTIDAYLPHCDRTQVGWIEHKVGRTMLARDDRGRKLYVVYFKPVIEEIGHLSEANIELSMEQVSYPEGFVRAEDGSWVPTTFFGSDDYVQAEDGSFVTPGFYGL